MRRIDAPELLMIVRSCNTRKGSTEPADGRRDCACAVNPPPAGALFARYPKVRPALPEQITRIYAVHYKENREGRSLASGASQKVESWLHRQVAKDVRAGATHPATLELGAGTLNQLAYEPPNPAYDIVEPFQDLYAGSALLGRVRHAYADISDVPSEQAYDRITSVATLEHICNLPEVVARSVLLLRADGVFRAAIPSEGTILWTLGWKLTTGLEFRWRHGLDYGSLMRHEHVNTAREIEEVLRFFFANVRVTVLGLSRSLSLYQFLECREPIRERAAAVLAGIERQPRV